MYDEGHANAALVQMAFPCAEGRVRRDGFRALAFKPQAAVIREKDKDGIGRQLSRRQSRSQTSNAGIHRFHHRRVTRIALRVRLAFILLD